MFLLNCLFDYPWVITFIVSWTLSAKVSHISPDVAFYAPYHTKIMQTDWKFWIVCKQKCCNGGEDLRRLHSSGDAWPGQSHAHRGKPWNWQNWHLKISNGWNFQPAPLFYASVSLQPGQQRAQVAFVKVCFCGTTATAFRRFYSWITFDTFLPEFFIFGSIGF